MSKALTVGHYRLLSMPHAQCRVYIKRFDDGSVSVELISYDTRVLIANYHPDSGAELFCSGTYSRTTSRHINRFTRELFGDSKYFECKSAVYDADKYVGGGWYRVCDVDPDKLFKMCDRYKYEARCYNGRY